MFWVLIILMLRIILILTFFPVFIFLPTYLLLATFRGQVVKTFVLTQKTFEHVPNTTKMLRKNTVCLSRRSCYYCFGNHIQKLKANWQIHMHMCLHYFIANGLMPCYSAWLKVLLEKEKKKLHCSGLLQKNESYLIVCSSAATFICNML